MSINFNFINPSQNTHRQEFSDGKQIRALIAKHIEQDIISIFRLIVTLTMFQKEENKLFVYLQVVYFVSRLKHATLGFSHKHMSSTTNVNWVI